MAAIGFGIGLLGMMFTVPTGFYFSRQVLKHLEMNHQEIWNGLGKPSLFLNNSIENTLKVRRFIRKKKYVDLNDTVLVSKIRKEVIVERIHMVMFLLALASFTAMIIVENA